MSTYLERFRDATNERGLRRDWSPAAYVEAWESFVTDCEEGYPSSIYEYENELSVRDVIERVLSVPDLLEDPAALQFAQSVATIDTRFASVLDAGPTIKGDSDPWWHRRVPGRAGNELATDVAAKYSVRIINQDG